MNMSETKDTATAGETGESKEFSPITTQEDLDRVITGRLERERKKYADYDDLKAAKAELDKIRESQKTDAEKQAEALKAQQTALAAAKSEAALARAALKHGLSEEDLELITGGTPDEIEAKAAKLAARLGNKSPLPVVDSAAKVPNTHAQSSVADTARRLFGNND
jgi:sRNA-binding protein